MLLHENNIGPEQVVLQLEALKIPMKVFDNNGSTIDSTKLLIQEIGAYFGKEKEADSICGRLDPILASGCVKEVLTGEYIYMMVLA